MVQAVCPICGGRVKLSNNPEVSEIITCSECRNRLVIDAVNNDKVSLSEAPRIEEDWGE